MKTLLISVDLKDLLWTCSKGKKRLFIGLQLNSVGCLGDHFRSFFFFVPFFFLLLFLFFPLPPFFFPLSVSFFNCSVFTVQEQGFFCLITKVYSGFFFLVLDSKALPQLAVFFHFFVNPSPFLFYFYWEWSHQDAQWEWPFQWLLHCE